MLRNLAPAPRLWQDSASLIAAFFHPKFYERHRTLYGVFDGVPPRFPGGRADTAPTLNKVRSTTVRITRLFKNLHTIAVTQLVFVVSRS